MGIEPPTRTVLFIDDEYFATSQYAEALTGVGFQVILAPSVSKAFDVLTQSTIDIVVVDLMMDAGDVFDDRTTAGGYKTGIAVSGLVAKRWPTVSIVVLTNSTDDSAREWFLRKQVPLFYKTVTSPYEFAEKLLAVSAQRENRPMSLKGAARPQAPSDNGIEVSQPGARKRVTKVRAARPLARIPCEPSRQDAPDVLILTAADIEYDTIIDLAGIRPTLRDRRRAAGGRTFIDLGLQHCTAWAFQCKKGSVGPGSSLDVVKDALNALNPKPLAVINTGIAFGLRPTKQDMGDVLVAEQVRLYEIERRGTVRLARGDKAASSPLLLSWFRDLRTDWASDTPSRSRPHVHFGVVLSGEKLSDDETLVSDLLRIEPEAVGGEMEAAGVYTAAVGEHMRHVHWIVVKGICDWGIGKGDKDQSTAAVNAIDLVLHVLDQEVVARALADLGRRPTAAAKRSKGTPRGPKALEAERRSALPSIEVDVVFSATGELRTFRVPYLAACRQVVELIVSVSRNRPATGKNVLIKYKLVDSSSGRNLDLDKSLQEQGYVPGAPRPRFAIHFQGAFACFPARTRVSLPDDQSKEIQDIEVGDVVSSLTSAGSSASSIVQGVNSESVPCIVELNGSIRASSSQTIFTRRGWKSFEQVLVGDVLLEFPDLREVPVISKKVIWETTKVFNLTVDGTGLFFADGLLVDDQSSKSSPFEEIRAKAKQCEAGDEAHEADRLQT